MAGVRSVSAEAGRSRRKYVRSRVWGRGFGRRHVLSAWRAEMHLAMPLPSSAQERRCCLRPLKYMPVSDPGTTRTSQSFEQIRIRSLT